MELFEEDVWDILDQENNLREIIEVSDEWLEYVTKEFSSIDVKAKDVISAAVCLLSILRRTIDLSDYVKTEYIKEQSSGNALESDFHPIAKNAFKATNKEYLFLHAITYANWKSLVLVKSDGRSRFLSLSIQGRHFLREQLGEIPALPKIEPDEFKRVDPYAFDGEGNPVTNLQRPPEPPLMGQNDINDTEQDVLSDDMPQQVEDAMQKETISPKRERYEVSASEVAQDAGKSRRTIEKWDAGEIMPPNGYLGRKSRIKYRAWLEGWKINENLKSESQKKRRASRMDFSGIDEAYETPDGKDHKAGRHHSDG